MISIGELQILTDPIQAMHIDGAGETTIGKHALLEVKRYVSCAYIAIGDKPIWVGA